MDADRKHRLADRLLRSGALAGARGLRAGLLRRPALTILGYHRVAVDPPPFSPLAIDPAAFDAQIGWFRERFDLWPLGRVADWLEGRASIRRDTLVITFDDGYADNLRQAAPILQRHGAPATFFVSTGPTCRGGAFWWDALRRALDRGAVRQDVALAAAPGELRPLVQDYYLGLTPERRTARAAALIRAARAWPRAALASWFRTIGVADEAGPNDGDLLGPEEIRDLVRRGFEIGAHGVAHTALTSLDPDGIAAEVRGSIDDLRALGIEATAFAYPYGDAGDAGGAVERAVRAAGVRLAVTTEERPLRRADDRLRLPRKVVPAQPHAILATRLERLAWSG